MTQQTSNIASRILIVEDDPAHTEFISRILTDADPASSVMTAPDLKSLKGYLATDPPDIILLDLNLPDGNALDFLSTPDLPRTCPVLIMTSYGNETLAVKALKAGALDYIVKSPETLSDMPRIVERSLREWHIQQQHQQAIEALRESAEHFRTLLQDVGSVAVQGYRADGTVHYWNTASETLYGYSAEEAHDKTLYELIIPPHRKETFEQDVQTMVATGEPIAAGEQSLRCKDGSTVIVYSSRALVAKPGEAPDIYCIDIDITERKRNEILLRKLSLAVEQSPSAVVITNLDAAIEYVNPKFTEVTGYNFDEVLGQNPRILQSGDMPPEEYRQLWAHLLAGEEWRGEFLNKRKDGRLFWEHAVISPLRDETGNTTHYIGIKEDITTQKQYEEQLAYQATHDELTGLANRTMLKDRIDQEAKHVTRSNRLIAVILLDLDRFKVINDSLGHALGDELLCQVARRLEKIIRTTDTVARIGGDEFVVLFTEVATDNVIRKLATKILIALGEPYQLGEQEVTLSASLGISVAPTDGQDSTSLIRNADIAMYQAKERKTGFSFYTQEMNDRLVETLKLEGDLRRALEREEFEIHYQPKIDLRSGRINGCEALLRWRHPQQGLVSPGQFIPLAEETGLIVPIGTWVLETACRQIKQWRQQGLPAIPVAVNLSARQLRSNDIVGQVGDILQGVDLDPRLLELELTESMIMDDPLGAKELLKRLKVLGVSLSLDDFGTGYSSLNYLRHFPFDNLKIDKSFINDVVTDPTGASVVTSIIDIAHNLGLIAIAEGVETREQLDFLVANQCDYMQGYLFSKPLRATDFGRLLASSPGFDLS